MQRKLWSTFYIMGHMVKNNFSHQQLALGSAVLANIPFLLWGKPGVGKTATLSSLCKRYNLHLETVILSTREPSDLSGIPYIVGGDMRLSQPDFVRHILEAKEAGRDSLLFFDEFSTAPHAMQAATLRVLAERVVGDTVLPLGCRVGAAANPPEIAAGGFTITPPAANRFVHIPYAIDLGSLCEGLRGEFPSVPVPVPPKGSFDLFVKRARRIISAFLSGRGDDSLISPSGDDLGVLFGQGSEFDPADLGFPSARMWYDFVAPLLAVCLWGTVDGKNLPVGVLRILMEGCLGKGVGKEFTAFVNSLDLPDPRPVLAGKAKYTVPKNLRNDTALAIGYGFCNAVKDAKGYQICSNVICDLAEVTGVDVMVPVCLELLKNRPEGAVPTSRFVSIFGEFIE